MSITIRFLRERGDLRWRAIECVLVFLAALPLFPGMIQDLFHLILMGVLVYKWDPGDDVNTTLNLKYFLFSALSRFIHVSSRNALKEIESSHI